MFLSALEKERTGGFQLEIGNIWTKLKIIHHGRAWDWVCDWLSYEDSDSSYSDAAFGGKTLLSFDDKFLTGFVVDLVRDAKAAGLVVNWVDLREKPTSVVGEVPGWLRDYQVDAVAACVGRGRGIVWAPTGSGKTIIAAAIMKMVDVRWLFLAHRRELVDQTIAKCRDFAGIECGGYGDGARVTVETYQTMHSRGPLAGIDGLICDEAHTIPASTFAGVCNAQDAAWYRLGLTGTPYGRGDGRSMFVTGLMGPVIYRIRPEGLISSGSLAKPVIKAVECKQEYKMVFHQSQVKRSAEWRKAEKTLITESALRNGMIADLIVGCAKPCIVFVAKRKHGELLLKACERAGVRAEYAHGDTANAGRTRTLERLAKGDIDVCIGTTIFDEGIDVPNVACVILAGGGKSSIKNIQRIGRGMRVVEGKTSVDIYDICDVGNSTLHEHWKLRRKAFESCGYDVVRVDVASIAA